MDDSTIVCKCEEINIAEIKSAINVGAQTFDDIKRLTRCGMGPCQANICGSIVCFLISETLNKPLSEIRPPKMRMPLKLVRLSTLVRANEESTNVKSVFGESSLKEGDSDD